MASKKADPRAVRSGFPKQLRAFFALAEEALEGRPARYLGPHNAAKMARELTKRGEPAIPRAVLNWQHAINLPASKYVAPLEEILGAPWCYLDNPKNRPPTAVERLTFLAAYAADPSDRSRALAELKMLDPGRVRP